MIIRIVGTYNNLSYKNIPVQISKAVDKELSKVFVLARQSKEHKEQLKSILISEQNYNESLDYLFSTQMKLRSSTLKNYIIQANAESRKLADAEFYRQTNIEPSINPNAKLDDVLRAKNIADNYENAYQDKYNHLLNDGLSRKDAREEASDSMQYKKNIISSTESFYAYNNQLDFQYSKIKAKRTYKAYLDLLTCNSCRKLHNKSFNNSIGVPPFHPNCRCMIVYQK